MDQRELINHCQLGDLNSFEELYRLYKHKALGTAYLIGGNKNIAEDIVQEAFVICYYQIKQLKKPDVFNIWFYRILVRVGWRMAIKQKNHVPLDKMDFNQKDTDSDYLIGVSNIDDISNDRLLIREAVKRLPPPLKTVVILFYFNEMTIKEISKVLNCFQGTIKSRLYKARKLLEKELRNSFENEFDFRFRGEELKENG